MGSSSGGDFAPPQQAMPQGHISPGVGMQNYRPSFTSFLPNDNSPASGLTPDMIKQIMGKGGGAPGGGDGGGMMAAQNSSPPGGVMRMPQLQMPGDDAFKRMGPMYRQQAQMIVDSANSAGGGGPPPGMRMMPGSGGPPGGGMRGIDAYLNGREQLAAIMNAGMNRRAGGGGGGGGYTTSGSAGVRGGSSSASKGGLT